jgi:hypothetical protein
MRAAILFVVAVYAAPTVRAADHDSAESVVSAVYETISGPAGTRDWARFRGLFADGARLITMRVTAEGTVPAVMSVEDYIKRAGANFEKNPFYETEAARRQEMFGSIAHVFSTYESRRAPGEKPFARGINSFQLVKDGREWKVMTILWDYEREGNPIPEKYLASPAPTHIALCCGGMAISASPQPSRD